jgi:hypothetical protein
LGITVTQIALKDLLFLKVKTHCTERTRTDAGAAADTDIVVNEDPPHLFIPRDGLHRTNRHAGRILTLLA